MEDPLFAEAGYWELANPDEVLWIMSDYHLQSAAGRFYAPTGTWIVDSQNSPCLDAGAPMAAFDQEPGPNGGRLWWNRTGQ